MSSAAAYYYTGCEDEHYQQPHFLDTCSLCQRHIFQNSDIFMYRGDTPFCSDECRQEQIEIDEENEKRKKRSSSSKRSSNLKQSNESVKDSDANKPVRTGSIAVS